MKEFNKNSRRLILVFAMAIALFGCSGNANQGASDNGGKKSGGLLGKLMPAPKPVTLPAGTEIHVVLDGSLSSNGSHSGDSFDAAISEPIVVNGKTVVAQDAGAKGTVVDARASGRLSKPALLSVALNSIEAGGSWVDVNTDSITLEGKSHKKRDIVAIGGGTGLGAIIGGIAGGGKGAAIGAAAGAGAGTAGAALTGKKDITMPAESRLTFRLSQPITLQIKQ